MMAQTGRSQTEQQPKKWYNIKEFMKQIQIGERMAKVEQKLDDVCEDINELKDTLNNFIKTADKRYAPAWVSWAMKLIIGVAVTSSVGYIIWTLEKLVEKTM